MAGNFDFLKKTDSKLFEIINEAENLYRDEYFDQCMAQTRRFGENVCKQVLGDNRTTEDTFDEMLATLKDKITGEIQEKEFIDDLYFLKKHGNDAVHSVHVNKSPMDALECLKRSFEIAINYTVYHKGSGNNNLKLQFDTELLVTGEKSKKSLSQKYKEAKGSTEDKKTNKSTMPTRKKGKSKKTINLFPIGWGIKNQKTTANKKESKKKFGKQSYAMAPANKKKKFPLFWIFVGISSFISLVTILIIFIASIL